MVSLYSIDNVKVYKYGMPVISSNMYIIIKGNQALVIDPHVNNNAERLLRAGSVREVTVILTHEHFDHISGVNMFRENWECTVYASKECMERIEDSTKNLAAFFMAIFIEKTTEEKKIMQSFLDESYVCKADVGFETSCDIQFAGLKLSLIQTPGHSPGSICILVNDKYIFTGDSLVEGNKVITRLPGGDRKKYTEITKPFLEKLSKQVVVFPGHGNEGIMRDFRIE